MERDFCIRSEGHSLTQHRNRWVWDSRCWRRPAPQELLLWVKTHPKLNTSYLPTTPQRRQWWEIAQPPCFKPFIPIICHRNSFLIILIAYKVCVLIEWVKSSQDCSSCVWRREECESRADTALAQHLLYPFTGLAVCPHLGEVRFLVHTVHPLGRLWEELSKMLQSLPSFFTRSSSPTFWGTCHFVNTLVETLESKLFQASPSWNSHGLM